MNRGAWWATVHGVTKSWWLSNSHSFINIHHVPWKKSYNKLQFSSVQSLSCVRFFVTPWITARQACPLPTLGVHSNSCPSSRWCHSAISSSVVPFSSCPQSPQHQSLFQWVNSSNEVAKVLEFQLQHQSFQWTPRTDLLYGGLVGSPCSPRDSQESSPTPQFKSINSSVLSFLHSPTLTSILTTGKTIALTRRTSVDKVMSLFFNMLSRLVITFLPRSKHLLISWLQSPSTVILEPRK